MTSRTRITLAVLVAGLFFADMASAQLFKRLWQRRKAEIRSELSHQLDAKLDADLEREMSAVG